METERERKLRIAVKSLRQVQEHARNHMRTNSKADLQKAMWEMLAIASTKGWADDIRD